MVDLPNLARLWSATLYADLSLIRDFEKEDALAERPVGITRFRKDRKLLYYVNAHHVSGIDNPTCKIVREAIENVAAERVIVEGLATECGTSPSWYVDLINREAVRGFPAGEGHFAAYLAYHNRIPFVGGEASTTQICSAMEIEGYSARDTLAFSLLQMIPLDRRYGYAMDRRSVEKRAVHFINHYASQIPECRLTFEQFEAWYLRHRSDRRDYLDLSTMDFVPYGSSDATYFQRFSRNIGMVRERHLDALIAVTLSSVDAVLVVYGDGHLVQSRAVFEKMLGPGSVVEPPIDNGPTRGLSSLPPVLDSKSLP